MLMVRVLSMLMVRVQIVVLPRLRRQVPPRLYGYQLHRKNKPWLYCRLHRKMQRPFRKRQPKYNVRWNIKTLAMREGTTCH